MDWRTSASLRHLRRRGYHISKDPAGPDGLDAAIDTIRAGASDPTKAARIADALVADVIGRHHLSMSWGDRLLTLDKSAAFRDDPRYRAAMATTSKDTGATAYASPDGIAWRLNTLIWAARRGLTLAGDFVECGVYKGDMSWVVTEVVDLSSTGKSFFLYDTFAGFSPTHSSHDELVGNLHAFAHEQYSRPGIYEGVCARFADKPYVKVIRGAVPDSLKGTAPDTIAFLHIDMNSPGPEIGAMQALFERVSPGAAIIYDDYGWSAHRKQKEAADAFMASRGHEILELPTGQGLVVKQP